MYQEFIAFIRSRKKVTLVMVLLNVLTFIVLSFFGNTENSRFMLEHGACYTPYILDGEYWRLLTGMFLHFGLSHLLYNMLCLLFMGDMLESWIGSVKFLLLYLLGGLGGNLLSMYVDLHNHRTVISAGASGAIFAAIGGFLYVSLRNRKQSGKLQLKRLLLMVVLMVGEGFTQAGTDNAAHIGGLLAGFLLCVILYHPKHSKNVNVTSENPNTM